MVWGFSTVLTVRRKRLDATGGIDPNLFLTYDEMIRCDHIQDTVFEAWYTLEGEYS